jgi:DNA-nicking Smr family endonuclease
LFSDLHLWDELKKTIRPLQFRKFLKRNEKAAPVPLKKNYVARPQPEVHSYVLDLHGLTLADAYDTFKSFVNVHRTLDTKYIHVITGKGSKGQGAIKKEIGFWLETPAFEGIFAKKEWTRDGGSLTLTYKRKKNVK